MERERCASGGEGCLVTAVRLPVRIVVLVLVVPVRMVWDALCVCGRFLDRAVLRPFGRGLARIGYVLFVVPLVWTYRQVLTPLGHGLLWCLRTLVVRPVQWLYAQVLAPLGHVLIVVPAVWLYRQLLTPLGRGIGAGLAFLWRWAVVVPAVFLWRWLLVPVGRGLAVVGREIGTALGHAWRIAGYVSLAVGRGLRWVCRTVLAPVGHAVRDLFWRPVARGARAAGRSLRRALAAARNTMRRARADVRRMLFGVPKPEAGPMALVTPRQEPGAGDPRTLDRSSEQSVSPHGRGWSRLGDAG